tara:strand:- start:14 stop:700 length:687 start_codon:yes stop_codon:yes gene_type:complete
MASEIRANKQTNRAGLGTVTYTDTGIVVSGIVTATQFEGSLASTPGIVATGIITAQSLDVDDFISVGSNIHLGNAGVITATSFSGSGANLTGIDATALKDPGGDVIIQAQDSGAVFSGIHTFSTSGTTLDGGGIKVSTGATISNIGNASFTGILTASSFIGDGSSLSNLPAGAPVGGASTNTVFFENDTAVAVNYQITSGKNAMSAGPIAINAGIAVTVPSGSSWTIV